MRTGRPTEDPIKRFFKKFIKTESCWLWTGAKDKENYGLFFFGKNNIRAHRYCYELHKEKIPEGLVLDHLCRNPSCVNPDHLEPVTNRENIRRACWKHSNSNIILFCKKGHELTSENVLFRKKGTKTCLICRQNYNKKYLEKLRENTKSNPKTRKKQTYCQNGHELSGNNIKITTQQRRKCLICYKQNLLQRRNFKSKRDLTHCKHGHEFTKDNTRINKGKRCCIACASIRSKKFYENKKSI